MPVGVYERNEKHLAMLEKARRNIVRKPLTEETKRKIGIANSCKINFTCDYCGNLSQTKPSAYNKKQKHFCSRKCYSQYRKEILKKEEHPKYGKGYSKEEKNKRIKARRILNHAIRAGVVIPKSCVVCGIKAEAHHDNYDKPLDVRWLCFKHHREYHKLKSNPELLMGVQHD